MTLPCYGESSFTMICSLKLVLLGMCSQSYYFERIKQLSLLIRDGLSLEEFISMVIIASCLHQMPTHGCQMPAPDPLSLSFTQSWQSWQFLSLYWLMLSELYRKNPRNYLFWKFHKLQSGLDHTKSRGNLTNGGLNVLVLCFKVNAGHWKTLPCYLFYALGVSLILLRFSFCVVCLCIFIYTFDNFVCSISMKIFLAL